MTKHGKDLWHDLAARNSKFHCLTETWLDQGTMSPIQIETELEAKALYHASFGRGKGCAITSTNFNQLSFSVSTEKFQ